LYTGLNPADSSFFARVTSHAFSNAAVPHGMQSRMPSTGYDRDAERIGFARGPRWRRVLAFAVFMLAVIVGALLATS
jgi:hypothetical protein